MYQLMIHVQIPATANKQRSITITANFSYTCCIKSQPVPFPICFRVVSSNLYLQQQPNGRKLHQTWQWKIKWNKCSSEKQHSTFTSTLYCPMVDAVTVVMTSNDPCSKSGQQQPRNASNDYFQQSVIYLLYQYTAQFCFDLFR
jgi:hypothetical protein